MLLYKKPLKDTYYEPATTAKKERDALPGHYGAFSAAFKRV
jgi:hypothetical protein